MSNIKNAEKPKPKTGSTALQEQASLAAIYYAYKKGATLNDEKVIKNASKASKKAQLELDIALKEIYPAMKPAWYDTFISQAQTLCGFKLCKHTIGSTTNAYDYGWYDGSPKGIPSSDQTSLLPDIWDLMGPKVWDLFGGKGQKDSWNTADVFLVKKGKDKDIKKRVEVMYDEFINKCCTEPGVFVGTVNTLLTQFVHSGDLLPISLKMKTSQTTMTVKETNMHEWKNSDKIEIIKSKFTTDPFMFMNVLERSKEISFGGGPNKMDGGNSLQYFADFKVGDYNTKYLIEYRLSGDLMKGEVKDIKLTNKGEDKRATAQTGTVPVDKLKEMIDEFSGKPDEEDIPDKNKTLNTSSYITTWTSYLREVMTDSRIKKKMGKLKITIGDINEDYTNDYEGYIKKLFEIDEMCVDNPDLAAKKLNTKIGKFPQKIRLKLRQLRVLNAMANAKTKGRLDEYVVHMYYLAAKQNISNADLNGPFLKLS